jgi:hypothetical protein
MKSNQLQNLIIKTEYAEENYKAAISKLGGEVEKPIEDDTISNLQD